MESMVISAAVAAAIDDLDKKSVMRPIYLDYNATTPMAPEVSYAVAEAWLVFIISTLTKYPQI